MLFLPFVDISLSAVSPMAPVIAKVFLLTKGQVLQHSSPVSPNTFLPMLLLKKRDSFAQALIFIYLLIAEDWR